MEKLSKLSEDKSKKNQDKISVCMKVNETKNNCYKLTECSHGIFSHLCITNTSTIIE